jgi:hypothetical protein
MSRRVDDDIQTRLSRIGRTEFERPGLMRRSTIKLDELTSRKTSTLIPTILDNLEVGFNPNRKKGDRRPYDVLLATNMISVGVDVQRLGLMVVSGQPKNVAEYIQATSRVGRSDAGPGLVCTVLNWARPRDMSHYETFESFHATFYKHVEALSVTPFAARSVDRASAGVITSMVRLESDEFATNGGAAQFSPSHSVVQGAKDELADRAERVTENAETVSAVKSTVQGKLDHWDQEKSVPNRTIGYDKQRDGRTVALLKSAGTGPWEQFTALRSMREVEPTVNLLLRESNATSEPEWKAAPANDQSDESSGE